MITVIYTYYNNPGALNKAIAQSLSNAFDNMNITWMVVDDASPTPLPALPPFWTAYRITKDIGWNAEGARNLAMHQTNSQWNLLTDLDCQFTEEGIINAYYLSKSPTLQPNCYNPVRITDWKHKNSYFAHREFYWECGGYDETYTGLYGYDRSLASAIKLKNGGYIPKLDCITMKGVSGAASAGADRDSSKYDELYEKLKNGEAEYSRERLRFPWKQLQ